MLSGDIVIVFFLTRMVEALYYIQNLSFSTIFEIQVGSVIYIPSKQVSLPRR